MNLLVCSCLYSWVQAFFIIAFIKLFVICEIVHLFVAWNIIHICMCVSVLMCVFIHCFEIFVYIVCLLYTLLVLFFGGILVLVVLYV